MKKITCVGYHVTGSGAVDDFFREFDNVCQGCYEAEASMLKSPDGVSDLEFHLVENPQRLYAGYAIKRFKQYVKARERNYKKIFGSKWTEISYNYADSLPKIKYGGYWSGDLDFEPLAVRLYYKARRAINLLMPTVWKKQWYYNYCPWLTTLHAKLNEDDFLKKTQDYVERLCVEMNRGGKEFVMLDQLIPPLNTERYLRYVRDLKVIIVDRDPRDVYIYEQLIKDHCLPTDPHEFCELYRDVRNRKDSLPQNVMRISFEDMIYNYEETTQRIMDFVGIAVTHHIAPKTRFNPAISIKGTKLWKSHPEYSDAVEIIAKNLPESLYDSGK